MILRGAKDRTVVNAEQSQDNTYLKWGMEILRRELTSGQLEMVVSLLGPPLKENDELAGSIGLVLWRQAAGIHTHGYESRSVPLHCTNQSIF